MILLRSSSNEAYATNNEIISIVRVKLLGDIDDTGVVEIFDIGIAVKLMGLTLGTRDGMLHVTLTTTV